MDYQELIKRLRYERDDGAREEAADAIEALQAELAAYRNAPVVAWYYFNLDDAECFGHPDGYYPDDAKPLIVKPGEEK